MSSLGRALVTLLGSLGACVPVMSVVSACARTTGACEHDGTSARCACEAARKRPDGTCCPGWTRASGEACVARALEKPSVFASLGREGARGTAIAVDGAGRFVVVWTVTEASASHVFVGEEAASGAGIAIREPTSALSGKALQPTVAAGPGRRATVTWKQETTLDESRVFVSERGEDAAWRDPSGAEDAFSFAPRAFEPQAVTSPTGEVFVVWIQWIAPNYATQVARRVPGGAWEKPTSAEDVLSFRHYYVNAPRLAAARDGSALVTWYQAAPDEKLMTYVSERPGASASFARSTGADFISPGGGDVGGQGGGSPKPAIGPNGEAAVAWTQYDSEGRLLPFVATRAPGGAWQKPARDASLGLQHGTADIVQVGYGGRGTLYVVWTQDAGDGSALYGLRRKPDGTWRDDPRAPVRLSVAGTHAQTPVLATGHDGALAVLWVSITESGSALHLRRGWDTGDADGSADDAWGPIETIATAERRANSPSLAFGGTPERLAIAWTEGALGTVNVGFVD